MPPWGIGLEFDRGHRGTRLGNCRRQRRKYSGSLRTKRATFCGGGNKKLINRTFEEFVHLLNILMNILLRRNFTQWNDIKNMKKNRSMQNYITSTQCTYTTLKMQTVRQKFPSRAAATYGSFWRHCRGNCGNSRASEGCIP